MKPLSREKGYGVREKIKKVKVWSPEIQLPVNVQALTNQLSFVLTPRVDCIIETCHSASLSVKMVAHIQYIYSIILCKRIF